MYYRVNIVWGKLRKPRIICMGHQLVWELFLLIIEVCILPVCGILDTSCTSTDAKSNSSRCYTQPNLDSGSISCIAYGNVVNAEVLNNVNSLDSEQDFLPRFSTIITGNLSNSYSVAQKWRQCPSTWSTANHHNNNNVSRRLIGRNLVPLKYATRINYPRLILGCNPTLIPQQAPGRNS